MAADDGVMPQTREAIDHAKAAGVPIVVAINKIDKPDANPDRVKKELSDLGLVPEEWGGADRHGRGLGEEEARTSSSCSRWSCSSPTLSELKANPKRNASGTVLEAKLDKGRGPVATILVQDGTLRVGDTFIAGTIVGKVRALIDDRGRQIEDAPGRRRRSKCSASAACRTPGDAFQALTDAAKARQIAHYRQTQAKDKALGAKGSRLTLESLQAQIAEGGMKELPIIIKADVQGSAEVLADTLTKLSDEKVKVRIIHSGVGAINESDVLLATASNAIIIGFNVRPERNAADVAEREKVDIRLHSVIYNVDRRDEEGDDRAARADVQGSAASARPRSARRSRSPKVGTIAGCMVTEGRITRSATRRRACCATTSWSTRARSARCAASRTTSPRSRPGFECGIGFERYNDIKVGDVIEAFVVERVATPVNGRRDSGIPTRPSRPRRVGEQIRGGDRQLLARDVHDPGSASSRSPGEVTPDLQLARVYYTSLGDEKARRKRTRRSTAPSPFLRRQIAQPAPAAPRARAGVLLRQAVAHQDRIEQILQEIEEDAQRARQSASHDDAAANPAAARAPTPRLTRHSP